MLGTGSKEGKTKTPFLPLNQCTGPPSKNHGPTSMTLISILSLRSANFSSSASLGVVLSWSSPQPLPAFRPSSFLPGHCNGFLTSLSASLSCYAPISSTSGCHMDRSKYSSDHTKPPISTDFFRSQKTIIV